MLPMGMLGLLMSKICVVGKCNTMGLGIQETLYVSNEILTEYLMAVAYVQLDHMGYTKIVKTLR
jgi:hypothetical protein